MRFSLKRWACIIWFIALSSVFALIYYGSYYYALNNMKSDNIITKDKIESNNPGMKFEENTSVDEVNSKLEQTVDSKTKYIEEIYNIDTLEVTSEEKNTPVEFIGLNRDSLINYLSNYKLQSKDETLVNIQLVSFSNNEVVVRKSIREVEKTYYYFVKAENDLVVIYKSDKITKYFETGINISGFDDEHKLELRTGFFVETIHDLYNYLESITS